MNERESALRVLLLMDEGVFMNDALSRISDKKASLREKGLRMQLVRGSLTHKLYLDYVLGKFSKIPLDKLHRPIYWILLMGIYQMRFLDRVPEAAIVNEAVKLAKKWGNKGSQGFVNGVLRAIARSKEEAFKIQVKDRKKRLSISYSLPQEWVEYFLKNDKIKDVEKFFAANNQEAPLSIRAVGLDPSDLEERLAQEGFKTRRSPLAKEGLVVEDPQGIFESQAFKEGLFYVQDLASQRVVAAFSPGENLRGLDLCAAPGGKSFQLAELCQGGLVSCDIDKKRLGLIRENMDRLGIKNIRLVHQDGSKAFKEEMGSFQRILVDAPCSGFGLLRRKPEIKYRVKKKDIEALSRLQGKILQNASNYLDPKGELVYSTCSVLEEENEKVIQGFLSNNKHFKKAGPPERLWPHEDGTDGFFIQKLVRKE
ncbi:MAG: 16S rRNA (cytosine(967)-C(5))-methyltransferase RsmB [Tissierellia bacterium]|nr:16S rRNA (cytosine(967)-C(5))-methyltransferase RsmB [Tissierellia bacterium]